MHCTKISHDFECQGQRSKLKVIRDKKRKTAESSPLTMHSKACASCAERCTQQQTIPLHAARGLQGDGSTRRRRLVGAVLGGLRLTVVRWWENQRMLSSSLIGFLRSCVAVKCCQSSELTFTFFHQWDVILQQLSVTPVTLYLS